MCLNISIQINSSHDTFFVFRLAFVPITFPPFKDKCKNTHNTQYSVQIKSYDNLVTEI